MHSEIQFDLKIQKLHSFSIRFLGTWICVSVANVSVDKNHNCQNSTHLGVCVAGRDHFEDIVVEVVEEGVQIFLGDLPQLSRDIAEDGRVEQGSRITFFTSKHSKLVGELIQQCPQATSLTCKGPWQPYSLPPHAWI